jgi:murein DD-endopeptidase MepM/ murein hydrolase activator NlpD
LSEFLGVLVLHLSEPAALKRRRGGGGFPALVVAVLSAGSVTPALAAPPTLELPVACSVGEDCFIQNFFDHDPGSGRTDYACGRLSYDGHDGTDFRLRDLQAMADGYAVLAAAPGVVKAVRDGMPDVSIRDVGPEAVEGREAGNGVVLEHSDGWETQYSHLRRGSVSVRPGDRVEAGVRLGLVGLSGSTEFPHVEFSVRHDDRSVDPFVGEASWSCGGPRAPLWSEAAQAALDYAPTGLLLSGLSDAAPTAEGVRHGLFRLGAAAEDPEALVLWVDIFGAEAGDRQRISIIAPDGSVFSENETTLENNVSWFAYGGARRPDAGWLPGTYTARYELVRDGAPVIDHERSILIGQ